MSRPEEYGTLEQVMEIYAGVYGVAPDFEGVAYWVEQIDAGNLSFTDAAASFFEQPLVEALYDGLEGEDLIAALYENVFRVDFGTVDQADKDYWFGRLDALEAGGMDDLAIKGQLAMEMIDGMWANPDAADTQALYENFVEAGKQFVAAQEEAGAIPFSEMTEEQQQEFLAAAQALTDAVTGDSTEQEIEDAVADAMGSVPLSGETFTLTPEVDSGPNFVGTDGNDTYEAPLVGPGDDPERTLNSFDVLDGGAGTDTLNAELINADDLNPTISNIEIFNLNSVAGGTDPGNTLDMSSVSGVEQIWNAGSTDDLTVETIQAGAVLGLRDVAGGTEFTAEYGTAVTEQTIVADGTVGAASVAMNVSSSSPDDLADVSLQVSGDSNLHFNDGFYYVENLAIEGDASLSLTETDKFESLQTLAAAGFSGDLDLDISGSGDVQSVATGPGDDHLTMAAANFHADADLESVDLGDGQNMLTLTDSVSGNTFNGSDPITGSELSELSFSDAEISGVQTLALNAVDLSDDDATLDLEGLDDLETLQFNSFNSFNPGAFNTFPTASGVFYPSNDLTIENAPADLDILGNDTSFNMAGGKLFVPGVVNLSIDVTGEDNGIYLSALSGAMFDEQDAFLDDSLETVTLDSAAGGAGLVIDIDDYGDYEGGNDLQNLAEVDVSGRDAANVQFEDLQTGDELDNLASITATSSEGWTNVELQGLAADDLDALEQAVDDAQETRDDELIAVYEAENAVDDAQAELTAAQAELTAAQTELTAWNNLVAARDAADAAETAFGNLVTAYNEALGEYQTDATAENANALVDAYGDLTDHDSTAFPALSSAQDIAAADGSTQAAITAEQNELSSDATAAQEAVEAEVDRYRDEVDETLTTEEKVQTYLEGQRDDAQTELTTAQGELTAAEEALEEAEEALEEAEEALADAQEALANPVLAAGFAGLESVVASGAAWSGVEMTDVYGAFSVDVTSTEDSASLALVRTGVTDITANGFDDAVMTVDGASNLNSVVANAAQGDASVDISNASGNFTLEVSAGDDASVDLSYTGVTSVDVQAGGFANVDIEDAADLTEVSVEGAGYSEVAITNAAALETVTIAGGAEDTSHRSELALTNTGAVSLIDVSGVDDKIEIDVTAAGFEGAVTVLIGGSDVVYETDAGNDQRETFVFQDADGTGEVSIEGFNASVGATGDRLDFSQMAGIDSLDDLDITFVGSDTVIQSEVAGIEIDITVVGVDVSDDPLYFTFA